MSKKVYDTVMLIVAICMLIVAYLTYDATRSQADVVQSFPQEKSETKEKN